MKIGLDLQQKYCYEVLHHLQQGGQYFVFALTFELAENCQSEHYFSRKPSCFGLICYYFHLGLN
jgi:hypothetical protein